MDLRMHFCMALTHAMAGRSFFVFGIIRVLPIREGRASLPARSRFKPPQRLALAVAAEG
jgi:hypothetical protein